MKQKLLYIIMCLTAVMWCGRVWAIDWVNNWSSAPSVNSSFYVYNTVSGLFMKAGSSGSGALSAATSASSWTYVNEQTTNWLGRKTDHFRLKSGNYYLRLNVSTNSTNANTDDTNGSNSVTTGYTEISFNYNGSFQIYHKVSNVQLYYLFVEDKTLKSLYKLSSISDKHEWYFINQIQYNNHLAIEAYEPVNNSVTSTYSTSNLPDAFYNQVKNYLNPTTGYLNYSSWLSSTDKSTAINNATSAINQWITTAPAMKSAYLSAVNTLNAFETNYPTKTTDTAQAAADLDAARTALEKSTDTDAIAAALKKVKNFDEITFTGEDRIRVNKSLSNVASAHNAVSCFSSSSIITASGTTLTAGSTEGSSTITATTSTGNGYYAASATKPFTVYKKTLTMNPSSPDTYTGEEYDEVTLSRTFKSGYNSIALPFSTDVATLTGRNNADDWVATLTAVTWNSTDGYTLFFTKGTTVEANKPYILHLGDEVVNPTWTNQEVMAAEGATVTPEKGGAKDDWKMVPNYTAGKDMSVAGLYGLVNSSTGGSIMKGGVGSTLNAFTAYFTGPSGGNVKARTSFLDFGDEETALENVRLVDEDEVEGYYATDGRRLAGPQKGIVVVKYRDGRRMKVKF